MRKARRRVLVSAHPRRASGVTVTVKAAHAAASAALLTLMLSAGAHAARTDVTIGMVLEPPNLDPTGGAAAAIDEIDYANVFEGLTRFGPDGAVEPALAASWEVSEDGRRYVFTLQENVDFHDGSEFDAEDVKFSIERALAEDSTNAQKPLLENIADVEVIDTFTVALNLAEPSGDLPFNLAWGDAVMLDEASAATAATAPVGTGPFRFERWVQGDRVELSRFEDYWGEPVALERVTFKFIGDPTAAFSAMMAGDLDAFPNFPAPENLAQWLVLAKRLEEADPAMSPHRAAVMLQELATPHQTSQRSRRRVVKVAGVAGLVIIALAFAAMSGAGQPPITGPEVEVDGALVRVGHEGQVAVGLGGDGCNRPAVYLLDTETSWIWIFREVQSGAEGTPLLQVPGATTLELQPGSDCTRLMANGPAGAVEIVD